MITMCKKLKRKNNFNACKKCSRNKRIALQNRSVFMTEDMLQMMKETKSINATKSI